ncbi:MAG TPA: hypothetical protein VNR89_04015 [Roseomonas sp.]|nr:hypothetical protein [Roseomonas sp.]
MTTLLIDGDGFAYNAAAAVERATDWGGGIWTLHANEDEALARLDDALASVQEALGVKKIAVAVTDQGANFRNSVWPDYKGKRKLKRKPLVLPVMRQHLIDNYSARLRPNLEADDVLGILATHPSIIKGEKIIVSADKDFFTIPGKFYRTTDPDKGVVDVSEEDADRAHLYQTLTGDTTDEYPGCPGIGPKKAKDILDKECSWDAVVRTYEKYGLTEDDAIVQARCARILRSTDYDFTKKEPILWTP